MAQADSNQSARTMRQGERRMQVKEEPGIYLVSEDYSGANLVTTRAAATWGIGVDVRGRDEVRLFVKLTKVAGQTDLHIALQAALADSNEDTEWYDRHTDWDNRVGGATAVPTVPQDLALDVSGFANGDHQIVLSVEVLGYFMRFKPWGEGTVTGSRATIGVERKAL